MAETLVFDSSLYAPEAVDAAVAAYSDFATLNVKKGAGGVEVQVSDPIEHEIRTIVHAFGNHVLHETIVQRRGALLGED